MKLPNKFHIKIVIFSFLIFLGTFTHGFGQERTLTIDKQQSQIHFKISHLGAFKVKGIIEEFSGSIIVDGDDLKGVECTVLVGSINTDNEERDRIISEEAYLNTKEFPYIIFKANDFYTRDEQKEIQGQLKIKDTEKAINFPYEIVLADDFKTVTLKAELRINRKDFNLIFGSMNGLIGNKVDIKLHIIATN